MAPHHVQRVKTWTAGIRGNRQNKNVPSYGEAILDRAECVEADDEMAVFEYTVEPADCNQMNNLHGGNIATIVDNLTSAAGQTRERKYFKTPGVSTDLHITYLNGAPLGTVLRIECFVTKVGANLAMFTAVVKDKSTGVIFATGTHTKFSTDRVYAERAAAAAKAKL